MAGNVDTGCVGNDRSALVNVLDGKSDGELDVLDGLHGENHGAPGGPVQGRGAHRAASGAEPYQRKYLFYMVGVTGFEPATSCSRSKRSTKLSYTPMGAGIVYGRGVARQ